MRAAASRRGFVVANSTLVVLAEARNYGGGDSGAHDLVAKRSMDWGRSWLPLQMVLEGAVWWGLKEGGPKGGRGGAREERAGRGARRE